VADFLYFRRAYTSNATHYMSRQYPRFLFQQVTGNDSERDGNFIVHLLQPNALFKIHVDQKQSVSIEHIPVKGWDASESGD
jgi:hypothetical protein